MQPEVNDASADLSKMSLTGSTKKKKSKKRPGRAITVEELFTQVSNVTSAPFNTGARQPNPVLTPRSAEACLKHGVDPETLRIRDLDSFKQPSLDPSVQRMRHEAYSQRRHEMMKLVRVARKQIISEQQLKMTQDEGGASSPNQKSKATEEADSAALLEIEKRRLAKMKARQQKELENMLQFEIKMNDVTAQANKKLADEAKREERRNREKKKRAKAAAEERRMRDLKKRAMDDAEDEKRRQQAYDVYVKEKQLADEAKRKAKLREIEARKNEEERLRKAEEHRIQTQAILKQQQDEVLERLRQMEEAEQQRQEFMERQRQMKHEEMLEKREIVQKRLRQNQKHAKRMERERRRAFEEKQRKTDEQRLRLQYAKEQELELQRQQAMLLERKRGMVRQEAMREAELKKEALLMRYMGQEENVARIQEAQKRELQLKREKKLLNQQLKFENVERQKRVEEYNRLQTMRKLKENEDRAETILQKKRAIVEQRKAAAIKSKIQKDQIVEMMEQVKATKKWKSAGKQLTKLMGPGGDDGMKTLKKSKTSKSAPALRSQSAGLEMASNAAAHAAASLPPPDPKARLRAAREASDTPKPYKSPYDLPPAREKGRKGRPQITM